MIQAIKNQGLKAALPLLLLATACGEGAPSAQQFDGVTTESYNSIEEVISANTDAYSDLAAIAEQLDVNTQTDLADIAEYLDTNTEIDLADIAEHLDANAEQVEAAEALAVRVANPDNDDVVRKVPEPTALAGLAIAGMGLIGIKRKQAA